MFFSTFFQVSEHSRCKFGAGLVQVCTKLAPLVCNFGASLVRVWCWFGATLVLVWC